MKFAVISDIHGNMDALEAVLADIDRRMIADIYCLGDSIGYGAESEKAVQELIRRDIPSVLGNHELVVVAPSHLNFFNPVARMSLSKCIASLSNPSLTFIQNMPQFMVYHHCRFVHGFPPDSVDTYLFQATETELEEAFEKMREWICFVGHTHDLNIMVYNGKTIEDDIPGQGSFQLDKDSKYIINIGSVGQPRDPDNNAKYLIMDTGERIAELRFVPYDIESAAEKIIEAGLPRGHANRLR